jgi:putative transcriptional regulator
MTDNKRERSVFEDVLAGLEEGVAWARGKATLNATQVTLPEKPPAYSPEQIRAIRARSGMSQSLFSHYISVSSKTLQSWEQGVRRPSPMSARFLQLIDIEPAVLKRVPTGARR